MDQALDDGPGSHQLQISPLFLTPKSGNDRSLKKKSQAGRVFFSERFGGPIRPRFIPALGSSAMGLL
jgi:hypothetical protein